MHTYHGSPSCTLNIYVHTVYALFSIMTTCPCFIKQRKYSVQSLTLSPRCIRLSFTGCLIYTFKPWLFYGCIGPGKSVLITKQSSFDDPGRHNNNCHRLHFCHDSPPSTLISLLDCQSYWSHDMPPYVACNRITVCIWEIMGYTRSWHFASITATCNVKQWIHVRVSATLVFGCWSAPTIYHPVWILGFLEPLLFYC